MTQTNGTVKALGIDVSKSRLDVAMWQCGNVAMWQCGNVAMWQGDARGESEFQDKHLWRSWRGTFANNKAGITKLLREVDKRAQQPVHACMEATGRYHELAAEMLHAAGHRVSVVNPAQIKHFREEGLVRNKTDALDAVLLLEYCVQKQPDLWTPTAPEIKLLQALYGRYDDLIQMRTQEINRLKAGAQPALVQTMIEDSIARLSEQIAQVERLISNHIDQHPQLHERSLLLESIDGIARLTAGRLLAFQIERFESPSALAAYAGVSPRNDTSGTLRKPSRMCRTGHEELRTALYMPALSSVQHNPVIKRLVERLRKRGLKGKQIVVAAMHKLLHLAWGVLKTRVPFDPDWVTT